MKYIAFMFSGDIDSPYNHMLLQIIDTLDKSKYTPIIFVKNKDGIFGKKISKLNAQIYDIKNLPSVNPNASRFWGFIQSFKASVFLLFCFFAFLRRKLIFSSVPKWDVCFHPVPFFSCAVLRFYGFKNLFGKIIPLQKSGLDFAENSLQAMMLFTILCQNQFKNIHKFYFLHLKMTKQIVRN